MRLLCSRYVLAEGVMDDLKIQVEPHIKRLACQLYTQLPEDKREALQVLRYVRQIIFCLGEEWETVASSAPVLPFPADRQGREGFPRAVPASQHDHPGKSNRE